MNTVFIGGSRHVSHLPAQIKERLSNVINNNHQVVVGDANGADKAVQKHLMDAAYDKVTVFCSGDQPRNNLGQWQIQPVKPPKGAKGFQFYAAKDREMARLADFGLMIWDGKSPGTVLNVLRLVKAGKLAVLINVPEKTTLNIKSAANWDDFLSQCGVELRADLQERATTDEWEPVGTSQQLSFSGRQSDAFLAGQEISALPGEELAASNSSSDPLKEQGSTMAAEDESSAPSEKELAAVINAALASGDPAAVVDALGNIARVRGMTHVAKEAGVARESLYRSLGTGGNPEFATVLKVMAAVGLRMEVRKIQHGSSVQG